MTRQSGILGWDIGGVNTKVTRLVPEDQGPARSISVPFELQHQPSQLGPQLSAAARRLHADPADLHAVTMTAELSQAFRSKREGVGFVLNALETTFPPEHLHVYTVNGEFVSPQEARMQPLTVAASNWAATANWVARMVPDCILLDMGTTTTDLIPIVDGRVVAEGRTDPERLISSELVYTGALRTPVEAIARRVPLGGRTAGVSAEGFAITGDVYLWLGKLEEQQYTCPPPDRRPATRAFAGERLARVVCGDRDLLQDAAIQEIAIEVARLQQQLVFRAIQTILSRFPTLHTAAVTGLGEFIAAEAARAAGLTPIRLADRLPGPAQTTAATAVACLLGEQLHVGR
jgi:(4-(4-[2-(gamma-L-glutamylamino)ethyl]phenoxymethyl)furan-2-yl)methanamine synthase